MKLKANVTQNKQKKQTGFHALRKEKEKNKHKGCPQGVTKVCEQTGSIQEAKKLCNFANKHM